MASSSDTTMKKGDAMAAAPTLMTAHDYYASPETVAPSELAYGVLHVREAPTARHQSAVLRMAVALEQHVRREGLGQIWIAPLDVVLDEAKALIVQPDVMFVSNARAGIVGDRIFGAPDLVIEVLSPNPRVGRTSEHLRWFAEHGVRECWLVHRDQRRISVIGFHDGEAAPARLWGELEPIRSAVLPDFRLSLSEILAG
jgi:Uma2 family endonuclease